MSSTALFETMPSRPRPAMTGSLQSWAKFARRMRLVGVLCFFAAWLSSALSLRAALQFDVFLGYDGKLREASWFPVACEVNNDGPTFNGIFELYTGNVGQDQVRRVPMEFPTNTRKRFVIPVFASGGRFTQWNARLLDDRGRVIAEPAVAQPTYVAWEGILMGAVPRAFAGVPVLPDHRQNRPELRPQVARMPVEQFPDNPIALEGLNALYLNSEKALALKVNQITALLAWVYEGGHLIIGVEQLGDVNSTPWLQQLLPAEVTDMVNVQVDEELQQWLHKDSTPETPAPAVPNPTVQPARNRPGMRPPIVRNRPMANALNPFDALGPDENFLDAQMPIATGRVRDGQVLLAAKDKPLVIQASRGRGQVTLLTFSPEREPFRSWKNRSWFWSKLIQIPTDWYTAPDISAYGGWSLDGVFGALIDSRQVRKLPVEWLLLLLLVYLIVIGPFDQYWLKKINRQMLTWITFPTYVVLFSLLIYFIGYKLRAGETEWNELQVVDVLTRGDKSALRGRTFASIYSSSNAKYQLAFNPPSAEAADQSYACLRGELLDLFGGGGGKEASRANVEQHGNVFRAEIFVPVWTSLLYVNDWFQPDRAPFSASIAKAQEGWQVTVENHLDRALSDARVVLKGFVYELGALPANAKKTFNLDPSTGTALQAFVVQHGSGFQNAVQFRRSPLGHEEQGHLEDLPLTAMVASFPGHLPRAEYQRSFVAPPGLDLTPLASRGDAVVLAWDANHAYANPVNQFKPPRLQRNSLLRLVVPVP